MAEGNSQTDGQPTRDISTNDNIMQPLAPGAFGVTETTTDVKAGMGNIETVPLAAPDGSSIFCEHHQLGVLPVTMPVQDVPPGEKR